MSRIAAATKATASFAIPTAVQKQLYSLCVYGLLKTHSANGALEVNEAGDGSLISAGISKRKWRARLRAVVECRVVGLRVDTRDQNGLGESRGE
jgi:hypothetical protein